MGRCESCDNVQIQGDELPPLREAMRDMQSAVAAYYLETARGGDLGLRVRTFFVEPVAQVNRDIAAGFQYRTGDVSSNTENAGARFPRALQGGVRIFGRKQPHCQRSRFRR